ASKVSLKLSHQKADWFLIALVLGLTLFGLTMVANASVVEAYRDFGDKLYYFKLQLQWASIGLLGFILASFFDYKRLRSLAVPLLIVALVSLALVLIPGVGTKVLGAQRWLGIGAFRFQPAELAKLAFVLYLAAFMSQKKSLWPFLILLTTLIGLIILEPDLGTAVIIAATGLVVYFASGAPIIWLGTLGILGLLAGIGLIFSSPYRKERILTFFDPTRDPLGASYHIHQILLA
ncbi:FtsW/RodA/SpoVE family cell cycle protein, partial [Candidatus Saccharibacteria bacterium]|nr:FtsW/RodA/SpoVE family cell cycle protein [Candidatus Saccharibacteria bacterium]